MNATPRFTLVGGTAILPDRLLENSVIRCVGERIESIESGATTRDNVAQNSVEQDSAKHGPILDVTGKFVAPGYIDIHVHGGAGYDFMDGTLEAVERVCRAHLAHGTTTIFPTTTTGSPTQIEALLAASREAQIAQRFCNLAGVHLYGPFFAEDKVGCHSLAGRRSPTPAEYEPYFKSDLVRIATCAAELPGASDFFAAATKRDCLVTCGHSNASWGEMQSAFEQGMRHVDHFWCAMSSVPSLRARLNVPMQASMAEFVLMKEQMSTEVIADGWHLAPELLEFAYRMIGVQRLCLVTDCNRALDMPAGEYRFGNIDDGSWFYSDGRVGWAPDRGSLASSVVGMDHMVRHMHSATTASLPEVIRMASLTPAERTGIADRTGSLAVGKQADLLVLSSELDVEQVYVRGREFKMRELRNA